MGSLVFPLKGPLKGKFDINEKCSMCDFKTYFIFYLSNIFFRITLFNFCISNYFIKLKKKKKIRKKKKRKNINNINDLSNLVGCFLEPILK